jgi:hypothetical protein
MSIDSIGALTGNVLKVNSVILGMGCPRECESIFSTIRREQFPTGDSNYLASVVFRDLVDVGLKPGPVFGEPFVPRPPLGGLFGRKYYFLDGERRELVPATLAFLNENHGLDPISRGLSGAAERRRK